MRLTYRALNQNGEPTGEVFYNAMSIKTGANIFPQTDKEKMALKKLATYEDTGLTPEDIRFIRMTQLITPEWLSEIIQAETGGRLVILPCKVGDTVHFIFKGKVYSGLILHVNLYRGLETQSITMDVKYSVRGHVLICAEEIGTTVFLTREEAEAALKGERENADT